MSITAVLLVYNEEKRIEAALKSFKWCDEIIVVDRNSPDRTREIAGKYTSKIFLLPSSEFSPQDNNAWLPHVTSEWVLQVTASDLIHPALARQIQELTEDPAFKYDVIHVPFRRYVLGLETPRSPWYSELSPSLLSRKNVIRIDPESVHGAIYFDTKRHYDMRNSEKFCMYHLTHSSADIMMDRHMVYCRAEARLYPKDKSLKAAFVDVFRGLYVLLVKRRTFMMGWNGAALGLAYLSYWMLRFVYIWEARVPRASETYAKIQAEMEKAWTDLQSK